MYFQIETDEDTQWKADVRETKAEVAARGINFMNWFVHVPFICICIVCTAHNFTYILDMAL